MQYIVIGLVSGIVIGIFITGKVLFDDIKDIQIQHAYDMAAKDETIERLQDELGYYRKQENTCIK